MQVLALTRMSSFPKKGRNAQRSNFFNKATTTLLGVFGRCSAFELMSDPVLCTPRFMPSSSLTGTFEQPDENWVAPTLNTQSEDKR